MSERGRDERERLHCHVAEEEGGEGRGADQSSERRRRISAEAVAAGTRVGNLRGGDQLKVERREGESGWDKRRYQVSGVLHSAV